VVPIDLSKQAEDLAQTCYGLSIAVDNFRIANYAVLSQERRDDLKAQSEALATRGQAFTAEALGAILQRIQPHLASIKQATQAAQDALAHLNDVAKGITIVDSAVTLVGSIATCDVASILENVQSLFETVRS